MGFYENCANSHRHQGYQGLDSQWPICLTLDSTYRSLQLPSFQHVSPGGKHTQAIHRPQPPCLLVPSIKLLKWCPGRLLWLEVRGEVQCSPSLGQSPSLAWRWPSRLGSLGAPRNLLCLPPQHQVCKPPHVGFYLGSGYQTLILILARPAFYQLYYLPRTPHSSIL